MQAGKTRKATHLLAGLALLTTTLMWSVGEVQAASFTSAPERLYMAPAGTTLIAELVGVPIGTLVFDGGPDIISQDDRLITVDTITGTAGCDLSQAPYDINDCSRIQLSGVSHGRLYMGAISTIANGPGTGDDVYLLPSGARIDGEYQVAEGSFSLGINGTPTQLNDALADLVYTPHDGYHFTGSNGETLSVTAIPGNGDDIASIDIQIRVLDVNDFPTHTGPANKAAAAQIELQIQNEFTVGDEDNDEAIDNDPPNPPCPDGTTGGDTGPCSDPIDGDDQDMLLIGWLDCGPEAFDLGTGFHFASSLFQSTDLTMEALINDLFPVGDNPDYQLVINAFLQGLDLIAPELKDLQWATSDPTTYTGAFAGVGTINDVQDALSTVYFKHNVPNDTCTLITVVSDLGNNGLPLQYVGSPPTGIEVPFFGFDWNELTITTGALDEITVNFDAGSLLIDEGGAPIEALAVLHITPAIHPEFTIKWDAVPRSTDPDPIPVGVATPNVDFSGTFNNTLTIPENETVIPILATPLSPSPVATNVFPDGADEGNETFRYVLDIVENDPPPGWFISSSVPTRTVVIVDDDDAPRTLTVSDPTVIEGDSGTTTATFTLSLDGPADGNESVQVATADGTATDGNNDYEPFGPFLVEFDPGQTTATVNVTVNGDVNPEADETFALNLSIASGVTLGESSAIGTIDNDDFADVSINDVIVTEGHDPTTVNASFTVQLSAPAVGGEQITVNTANATATTADNDYDAVLNQTITFDPLQTFQTVDVTVNGDNTAEPDQTFSVVLSNPTNLNVTDGTGVGTVTNDDIDVSIAATASIAEGLSGPIPISISPAVHPAFDLTASTSDVSTEPADYTALTAAVVSVVANDVSTNVVLQTTADTDVEGDEDLTVMLSPPSSQPPGFTVRVVNASSTVTISDDDALGVSINNVIVTEGNTPDTILATFVVQLSGPAVGGEQITVNTSNGTATTADNDYVAITNQVITFLVGETSKTVNVTVNGDTTVEPDQTFNVVLSSPNLLSITDGAGIGTITNDDLGPPLSIADASVTEGTGAGTTTITLNLTTLAPQPIDCGFRAVLSHVSTVDADFTPILFFDVTAVWDTDDQDVPRTYSIDQDAVDELNETFTVTITGDVNHAVPCAIADGTATGTIIDDDGAPPDSTKPTVTINEGATQDDPTTVASIVFDVVFSESVTGFATGDVSLTSSSAPGALVGAVNGSGASYTVTVTGMTGSGTVIVSIDAEVAQDAAANTNDASTSTDNSVQYNVPDTTAPTVTINQAAGQDDPTTFSPVLFTVVFSEPVTGFTGSDIVLSGTANANAATVSGGPSTYSVEVTGMSGAGSVIADIAAGAANDLAPIPNASTVSTSTDKTVQFNVAPGPLTLNLPANIVTNNAPGLAGATVSYPTATASGGTPPTTVVCTPASATFYPLGVTTVTCTATDSADASVTGTFTIRVNDAEPPVIADLPDLTRSTTNITPVAVTFPNPAATDNSGVAPTVVCTPGSGSLFQVGIATVTCTATDGAGNQASSSFTVTVNSTSSSGVIPVTGSAPFGLLLAGLAMFAAGLFLLFGPSRRRAPHTAASRR